MAFYNEGWVQNYIGPTGNDVSTTVKLNTIVDFWSNPCDAPWTVYVQTLYPVFGNLALVLIDFDLLDVLRSCFRPDLGLGRGKNRSKGRRRRGIPGIPEPSDLICRLIGASQTAKGTNVGAGAKWLWRIDTGLQRLLWYWLVIDLSIDGFYFWASLIKAEGFCQKENAPSLFATDETPNCNAFFGAWLPAGNYQEQWGDGSASTSNSVIFLGEGDWELMVTGEYKMTGTDDDGNFEMRMIAATQIGHTSATLKKDAFTTVTVSATVKGPTNVLVEQRMTGALNCGGQSGILTARRVFTPS